MNIRMNAKNTTVSIVLAAMFLGAAQFALLDKTAGKTEKPTARPAKAKPKAKTRKSKWGDPDLTGVKKREIVYKKASGIDLKLHVFGPEKKPDKPVGAIVFFFNADDYMRATMFLADKFLTSLGYLQGQPTIDTKGLNTPQVDLKAAGK